MNNDKPEFKYFFSVVTACYNVELYVEEAIKSILKQTIGFKEHIQLILVDDGSTDNTAKILDKYASKYPYNIFAVHKENGGVSSARNEGLKYIQGKYVNFMDADDKFSPESFQSVYAFFQLHYEETDVVTVPIYFFEGRTGEHHLNKKFEKGSRILDIGNDLKDRKQILKHVNATFFKTTAIGDNRFDTGLSISEDVKFLSEIISKKLNYGVCVDASYQYRYRLQGEQSALQGSLNNVNYYLPVVNGCYKWILESAKAKYGSVPAYYQNLILDELFWRLKNKQEKPEVLTDEEWAQYGQAIKDLSKLFDDWAIMYHDTLYLDHKIFILYQKHHKYPDLWKEKDDVRLAYGKREFARLSNRRTVIDIVELNKNSIHIEGNMRFVGVKDSEPVKIYITTGRKKYYGKTFSRNTDKRDRFGFPIYNDVGFSIDVPLKHQNTDIFFGCTVRNVNMIRNSINFGNYAPVGKEYDNAFYYKNGWLLTTTNNQLNVKKCGRRGYLRHESALLKELRQKKEWKSYFSRVYFFIHSFKYTILKKKKSKKERWLVFDRVNKGDDNGEAFFEYLQKNKRKQVKSEFLIQKSSPDYRRIKKIGKVTPILSRKHKLHYLRCDMVVTSNGDEFIIRPLEKYKALRDICVGKKYVFLQHGVINNDLSDWLNKYNKNIYKFVTTTISEYRSIFTCKYFYTEKNVILTGLPRYDRLYNDSKKYIAIMPTWRQYLNGYNDGGVWTALNDFAETDYFNFYNSLINDKRLLSAAKEYGYKIAFLPHPNVYQAYINLFGRADGVIFLPMNTQYRKVFAESDLLVTDYSSVAFDFAYLRKPVVYSQFDSQTFFNGKHVYSKGYFDYETMGFGEVCPDLQSTVDTLIDYMQSGCSLKDKYKQRINDTFPYTEKNNCQRVFKEIYGKKENK